MTDLHHSAIEQAAADATAREAKRRIREIHDEALAKAQEVLDSNEETKNRRFSGRSTQVRQRDKTLDCIEERIILACANDTQLLSLNISALLRRLKDKWGLNKLDRSYVRKPLKKTPSLKARNPYWYISKIIKSLDTNGLPDFVIKDKDTVEDVLEALRVRLLPPPEQVSFPDGTIFTDTSVKLAGKKKYRLHLTASGKPTVKWGANGKRAISAISLFELLVDTYGEPKGGRPASFAIMRADPPEPLHTP